MKTKHLILFAITMGTLCITSYFVGWCGGRKDGAAQMARHLLNPKYNSDSFVNIARKAENE